MAQDGYYATFYNQQPPAQPSRPYENQSAQGSQSYEHDQSSSRSTFQHYPQTYNGPTNYGNTDDWYGSNPTDSSLGRAAEALSTLGSVARQAAVSSSDVTNSYAAHSQPSANRAVENAGSSATRTYGYGDAMSPSYSYQNPSRRTPHDTLAQQPARPENVNQRLPSGVNSCSAASNRQYSPLPTHLRGASSVHGVQSPVKRPQTPSSFVSQHSHTGHNSASQQLPSLWYRNSSSARQGSQTQTASSAMISSYTVPPAPQGPNNEQQSYTVDPAQVYDPWPEYQRRKAAEDAQRAQLQAQKTESQQPAMDVEAHTNRAQNKLNTVSKGGHGAQSVIHSTAAQYKQGKSKAPNTQKSPKSSASKGDKSKGSRPIQAKRKDGRSLEAKAEDEDEDTQMLAMLKTLKARDPERFKRLMDIEENEAMPSTSASATVQSPSAASLNNHSLPASGPSPATRENRDKMGNTTPINSIDMAGKAASEHVSPARSKHGISMPEHQARTTSLDLAQTAATGSNEHGHTASVMVKVVSDDVPTTSQTEAVKAVWPSDKKFQLARAAAKYLNSQTQPGHKAQQMQESEIIKLLDQNPPYVRLCQQLEAQGLKVDRTGLARSLLQAVPDLNTATQKQRREKDLPLQGSPLTQPCMSLPATQTPATASTDQAEETVQRSENPSTAAAASKEEAARKRNFSDMVDLTALSDEEPEPKRLNFGTHQPYSRFFGPALNFGSASGSAHSAPESFPFPDFLQQGLITHRNPLPNSASNAMHAIRRSTAQMGATSMNPVFRDMILLSLPIDRTKARRRASYDPKTIARDVLLATGRHPDMHHLNAHLEGLRFNKHGIATEKSDLSTLRWDLMDPGDPPSLPTMDEDQYSVVVDADPDADDEDEEPSHHPSTKPHVLIQRSVGAGKELKIAGDRSSYDHSKARLGRSKLVPTRGGGHQRDRGKQPNPASPTVHGASSPQMANSVPLYRRFVHTPNQGSDKLASETRQADPNATSSQMHPSSETRPSDSPPMSGTGYSAFRQLNPDGTKKRGRPVGWRKSIHMDPSKLTVADHTKATEAQQKAPVPEPGPRYQIFYCRWAGCSAQLHNLKTLRTHVTTMHKSWGPRGYTCQWNDCGRRAPAVNEATGAEESRKERINFTTSQDWVNHIERKHVTPIAWQMGDGPPSGLSDSNDSGQSEAYLSDSHGRLVTPRIRTPPQESGSPDPDQEPNVTASFARGNGKLPVPKRTLEQKALDAEEALRNKKRQIGIGLDKGGATLANEKRRQGFIDDDDFEAIVDDE